MINREEFGLCADKSQSRRTYQKFDCSIQVSNWTSLFLVFTHVVYDRLSVMLKYLLAGSLWEKNVQNPRMTPVLDSRIPSPRTSHGGLRNLAFDHPRIPPPPELEPVIENFETSPMLIPEYPSPPRIGTSHGEFRNFTHDHPRISPELKLLMETLCGGLVCGDYCSITQGYCLVLHYAWFMSEMVSKSWLCKCRCNPFHKALHNIPVTCKHKNAFQWDAYRPLVDRIPACTMAGGTCPGGCACPGTLPPWTEWQTRVKT